MSLRTPIKERFRKLLQAQSVERAKHLMQSRSGLWVVSMISFVESALPVPLLTDPFMSAAILLNRQKAVLIVFLTTVSSVLGGLFAYAVAYLFIDLILELMTPAMTQEFNRVVSYGDSSTFMLSLLGAVTPVPYTLTAWAIAVIQGNLLIFLAVSFFGRGFRYVIVGYCTYYFGPTALQYARRYLGISSFIILLLVGALIWYKM